MWRTIRKLASKGVDGTAAAAGKRRDVRDKIARSVVVAPLACSVVASGAVLVLDHFGAFAVHSDSIARLSSSLVSIRSTGVRDDPFDPLGILEVTKSTGSGFVVTAPSGARYVLTNSHVVEGALGVFLDDAEASSSVVFADRSRDVAAIALIGEHDGTVLCDAEPEPGAEVVAVGDPYGLRGSLSRGVVSAVHRAVVMSPELTLFDMVQTDALLNPGNSGGPLFDLREGCVLGMNTVIMSQPNGGAHTGIGFAVPARVLADVVKSVDRAAADDDSVEFYTNDQRSFSVMSDADADALGVVGAIVTRVFDGCELQGTYRDAQGRPFVRDVIVGFRREVSEKFSKVASAADLEQDIIRARAAGEEGFTLEVVRGGDVIEQRILFLPRGHAGPFGTPGQ